MKILGSTRKTASNAHHAWHAVCAQTLGLVAIGAALLAMLLAGCTVIPTEQAILVVPPVAQVAASGVPSAGYLINTTDELEVKFPDRPDLNEVVRVRPDGWVSLRLINAVRADGRTPKELETEIAQRYRELSEPAGAGKDKRYQIGVGDELDVRLPHHQGMDQSVKVRPDGKISLNLVKTIQAEGKSPEELEAELNEKYKTFLKRPDLVVVVRNYANNRAFIGGTAVRPGLEDLRPVVILRSFAAPQVFVGGEVTRPGVLAYRGRLSALSAIVESGGTKPGAQVASVLVLRRTGPEQAVIIRRDLRPDQNGEGTNDILLEPFDIVVVPKTAISQVGEFMEQLFGMLPPLKNSAFGFAYQLNSTNSKIVLP